MDRQEMTVEELREYLKTLPENVIIRITVMEDENGSAERENV